LGFLQELNRRFLHPCGLALSVEVHEDGTETFDSIFDFRDDPEGILFEEKLFDDERKLRRSSEIDSLIESKINNRKQWCDGNGVQKVRRTNKTKE
jgi:hypothetical protein